MLVTEAILNNIRQSFDNIRLYRYSFRECHLENKKQPDMIAHTFNSITGESEAG